MAVGHGRQPVADGHLPGDVLTHPAIVASLGLLLLNDFYLKSAHPGPMAWKLSDFAGLALFPALLFSVSEIAATASQRHRVLLKPAPIWVFAGITAASFALVKLVPAVGNLAEAANDLILPTGRGPTVFTPDASDLLALPAVLLAVWVAYRMRD